MAESTAAADFDSSDTLKSVADALETAFQAVKDGSADATAAAENALPGGNAFCRPSGLHDELHAYIRGCLSVNDDRQINTGR